MRLLRRRRPVPVRRFDAATGAWADIQAEESVDCTELTLKGIGVDHLKVIDHKKGSNLVYTRAAACRPIDNLKK